MSTPTTRRHPRTMAEAWPTEAPPVVEHYRRPGRDMGDLLCAVACFAAVVLIGAMCAGFSPL